MGLASSRLSLSTVGAIGYIRADSEATTSAIQGHPFTARYTELSSWRPDGAATEADGPKNAAGAIAASPIAKYCHSPAVSACRYTDLLDVLVAEMGDSVDSGWM